MPLGDARFTAERGVASRRRVQLEDGAQYLAHPPLRSFPAHTLYDNVHRQRGSYHPLLSGTTLSHQPTIMYPCCPGLLPAAPSWSPMALDARPPPAAWWLSGCTPSPALRNGRPRAHGQGGPALGRGCGRRRDRGNTPMAMPQSAGAKQPRKVQKGGGGGDAVRPAACRGEREAQYQSTNQGHHAHTRRTACRNQC